MKWSATIPITSMAVILAVPQVWANDSGHPRTSEAPSSKESSRSTGNRSGTHVRLGGVTVGAGYAHFSGYSPYWSPYYGGYWSPFWDPFWGYGWSGGIHPGYYRGFGQGPGTGLVKLKTPSKQAEVYIDGAYAGEAKDLRNIWLEPGAYNLEIREDNQSFQERVYVLTGKTVRVNAELASSGGNQP